MAKRCPEEFNPWPPFVDIFASVILVMLLFLLITIVNIGYYAQFKYKVSYTASTTTQEPIVSEEQSKVTTSNKEVAPKTKVQEKKQEKEDVSFHKIDAPSFKDANNSLFSGGTFEGNALSYAANKTPKEFNNQKAIQKDLILTVHFKDKEVFVNSSIKSRIKRYVGQIQRRSKNAVFTLYVSDPKNMVSSTLAKQVSLGRVLNIKGIIKHSNVQTQNIKLNLLQKQESNNPYGDIIIKAMIP